MSSNLKNIIRLDRFDVNFLNDDNQRGIILNDYVKQQILNNNYDEYKIFEIIREKTVYIKIDRRLHIFENLRISNYEEFIIGLKSEINNLNESSSYQNKQNNYEYKDLLEKLSKENFYEIIIKIYDVEGFLHKELNKMIRENEIHRIRYYYTRLLASFSYYSL